MIPNNIELQGLSEALAWTLLHSIWQAALIAGLLAIVFRIINTNNSRLRYALASFGLLLIFITAVVTFLLALPEETMGHNIEYTKISHTQPINQGVESSWHWLRSLLPTQIIFPILLRTWLLGISLLSIKMLIDYHKAFRLKNDKAFALNGKHAALAKNLLKRFKLNSKVVFRESALVDTPSLIGYFRPVVLLPISLLSGIPDNQLEIIIAHELAHIRRHDYLVRFIQGIIEILFFYHPLVWWLSSVVNTEREHICDDLAVKVCGESLTLIKALNNMESIRKKQPELVLNFSGQKANLLNRVRRILNPHVVTHPKLERGLLTVVFVFALSGLVLFSNLANSENQVNAQGSTNLSLGDLDNNKLGQVAPVHLEQKKRADSLTSPEKVEVVAKPSLPEVPSLPESPALPEVPEVPEIPELNTALQDTLIEMDELIEIQEEILKEALEELDSTDVTISEQTLKELQDDLKELESFDFDIDVEKELKEAELEIEKEFEKLEKSEENHVFKDIEDNQDLSDKEKEELKAKVRATLKRVNSEEFRQGIRENLEHARETMNEQLERIKSGDFKKSMEMQKEKIKDMIKKFESPEYQKDFKENLKRSRESIEKHLEKLKSPEYRKELEKMIEDSKKKKGDTVIIKRSKIKIQSSNTPLYIVDGAEISSSEMKKLDPGSIESISVIKDKAKLSAYGKKGKEGVILISTRENKPQEKNRNKNKSIKIKGKTKNPPLYIIDGTKMNKHMDIEDIDPDDIESMTVLKDEDAIEKYGKEAKNGVIEITTKDHRIKNFNEYMKSK